MFFLSIFTRKQEFFAVKFYIYIRHFSISCENGQEEHLGELSIFLNQKFNNLKDKLGNIGENKLLLITFITVMDEYFETKKKIDQQKNEIKNITEKFKELKESNT
jgi:cell division protein ZapA